MAAILTLADGEPLGIDKGSARIGGRCWEGVISEAFCGLGEDQPGLRHNEGLVRIFVAAWAFKDIAAFNPLAAQIACLAGGAAQALEVVIVRLDVVIADAPVLDRHVLRDCVATIALRQMTAQDKFARQKTPSDAVPVRAGTAETIANGRDVPLAHR
jgi:hypothetical protein